MVFFFTICSGDIKRVGKKKTKTQNIALNLLLKRETNSIPNSCFGENI